MSGVMRKKERGNIRTEQEWKQMRMQVRRHIWDKETEAGKTEEVRGQ